MSTANPVRFAVVIDVNRDMPGFLDMLRYDRATVVDWAREAGSNDPRFGVTLAAERYPTVRRWISFGIYPKDAATGERLRALY